MKAPPSSTSSSELRGRRALHALGWAALLAVAVDLACRLVLPTGYLPRMEALTRHRIATSPAPDIEIVGDSVAHSGFLASGLSNGRFVARNSALPASGPVITYYLLKEEFEAGHIPRALIIAHSPHNFSQFRYAVMMGSFAHWRELPDIMREHSPWSDSAYAVLTRLSFLLMHRDSFQAALRDRDFTFFTQQDSEVELLSDRSELINFRKELPQGIYDQNHLADPVSEFYSRPFSVLDINDQYFRRLLAMARAYGVKAYWFTMPTPARVRDARAGAHFERDLLAYLHQFEETGELKLLRAGFVVYPDILFRDELHLNLRGAVRLSCEMRELRKTIFDDLEAHTSTDTSHGGAAQAATANDSRTIDADDPQAVLDEYCRSP